MTTGSSSRLRRLSEGWSANLVQVALGIVQQVALIPVFLHHWSSDVLAAWLAIYAAGSLAYLADAGLQVRAINRFLRLKAATDWPAVTARFYTSMLRVYVALAATLTVLLLAGAAWLAPSATFGFASVEHFDAAFVLMIAAVLWTVPSNLASALYRSHGLYGRAARIQNTAVLAGQFGQLIIVVTTGSLLGVTLAYAAAPLAAGLWLLWFDAPRRFPFLRGAGAAPSWRWAARQFREAAPFAVAGGAELALLNLPVLLVSIFISDRVAVAQWALTRVVAGLVRTLCIQVSLPLAAELGHDHAVGDMPRLQALYARGSVLVTFLASVVVSGLLPFWPDFFALWTRGAIPYNPILTATLLIGTAVAAPSILALGYANYSDRGELLVRTKALQLVLFIALSAVLIPLVGLTGAAAAIVASEILIQFGILGRIILQITLQHPLRHVGFLAVVMTAVIGAGSTLGMSLRMAIPMAEPMRFFVECGLWLAIVVAAASPLANRRFRTLLTQAIPR
jgi:O-antigen/teichoic acid export membrane protein